MKNLKNFAFGLLVAVLAFSFSAFTAAQNNAKRLDHRYINDGDKYLKLDDAETENCTPATGAICILESNENREDGFEYNNVPMDAQPYDGSTQGVYTP